MKDFWLSCGHHLTDRDPGGGLLVTDEYLKAYLARPELTPPPEACAAEHGLRAMLLSNPRQSVSSQDIAAISDVDARENWSLMIAFRDRLLKHRTLESAYLDFASQNSSLTPPIFLNHLVHVILRNVLDGCQDPYALRAAELLFRPQRLAVHEGVLIAADEETIAGLNTSPVSPLVSMLGIPASAEIDVLTDENAEGYWKRSDLFDTALDLTAGRAGLKALGHVLACWVAHLLAVEVEVEPLTGVRDVEFAWYVGLNAEGTRIGDALWNGEGLDNTSHSGIVGLYRLTFKDADVVFEEIKGEPVYLILAMTPDKVLRVKPQNLLTGLPVRRW